MTVAAGNVVRLDRAAMQHWLPKLDEWLLPGLFYGVQHTWPQLYRSDGDGMFFALFEDSPEGERLVSHCACRVVTVETGRGSVRCALLGSVATDPARRGQGHANQVLAAALAACDERAGAVLLWAERPELYARHGFVAGRDETCLAVMRRPRRENVLVRHAEVRDHAALHALHERNPLRVVRSPSVMSGLLTTPGMTTVVLEEDVGISAYACCGKGADLQGHWHELGGTDAAVARLLPAAMHVADQLEAVVLVPPYRQTLRAALGASVVGEGVVPGPMVRTKPGIDATFWIDGLDSV
ncbi:MAG: GNAT family N-acetyltransferase [Planctomycetes bacterium]|nr:GNAT family N-acetyltransferase [Planctomycetota bacterium]